MANLETLLKTMIGEKSFSLLAGEVPTEDPAQLTVADAKTIAYGVTAIVRGHVVPANAIAEVLAQYRVLRETAEQCSWFEPMLAAIVVRLMAISVGKALRLALSSSLSIVDVGSDVFTMLVYYLDFDFVTGSLILAMLCFSVIAQIVVVVSRHQHRSAKEITIEVQITVVMQIWGLNRF